MYGCRHPLLFRSFKLFPTDLLHVDKRSRVSLDLLMPSFHLSIQLDTLSNVFIGVNSFGSLLLDSYKLVTYVWDCFIFDCTNTLGFLYKDNYTLNLLPGKQYLDFRYLYMGRARALGVSQSPANTFESVSRALDPSEVNP
jgi:hypothetical protein